MGCNPSQQLSREHSAPSGSPMAQALRQVACLRGLGHPCRHGFHVFTVGQEYHRHLGKAGENLDQE
jgi:hypothetical protein